MSETESSPGPGHEEPHELVEVRFLGVDGWAVGLASNEDRSHQEFRLLRGEGESELLGCYTGEPWKDDWGVPRADVLSFAAHVGWHVATGTPPSTCPEEE